ncbi:hypothetical protein MRX96_014380 [Rhipicephalus microplus]
MPIIRVACQHTRKLSPRVSVYEQNRQSADSLSGHLRGRANLTEFRACLANARTCWASAQPAKGAGTQKGRYPRGQLPIRYLARKGRCHRSSCELLLKRLHGALSYDHSKVRGASVTRARAAAAHPTCALSAQQREGPLCMTDDFLSKVRALHSGLSVFLDQARRERAIRRKQ